MALRGSITRMKITAFTFNVTLSRVMMSCGGTSSASCRSETRTMRSNGLKTKMMPGPLGSSSRRPRRKITPRSYSARILMQERTQMTTMTSATRIGPSIQDPPACLKAVSGADCISATGNELPAACGKDCGSAARPTRDGSVRSGVPNLAVDEHLARGRELRARHADLAD